MILQITWGGEGSTETPKSDYVLYGRPLETFWPTGRGQNPENTIQENSVQNSICP